MVHTFSLGNGVTGIVDERPGTEKTSINISIKKGALHESASEKGLNFLMTEALLGGTQNRSRSEIAKAIEDHGGNFYVNAGKGNTDIVASVLKRHTDDSFRVLVDMLRNPAFDQSEIDKTKKQISQWLSSLYQNPGNKASIKYSEMAFGSEHGAHAMGEKSLLDSFTPEQIRDAHKALLANPEDIVVSFSGDIDRQAAEKLVKDAFDELPPSQTPRDNPVLKFTGEDFREEIDNDQLNIMFGFDAPGYKDAEKPVFTLLRELISGGMSAPLFQEIREKRGLVYSVQAQYAPGESGGTFAIMAGTGKGNAGELVDVSLDLLGDVAQKGFTRVEIDTAIKRLVRKQETSSENSRNEAASNAGSYRRYGRVKTNEEFEFELKQVTPNDIRAAAANMLKDGKVAVAAIGPLDTLPSHDEIKAKMKDKVDGLSVPAYAAKTPSATMSYRRALATPDVEASDPKVTTLPNGMRVVTIERPGTLSVGAWVGAGAQSETPALNGATHMNEHMMFKGTPSFKPGDIDRLIEGKLAGGLNAYTGKDQTAYYFYSLKPDDAGQALNVLGEMVFEANISHDEFEGKMITKPDGSTEQQKGERYVVIEEIRRSNDSLSSRLINQMDALAYDGQAMGRPILGTEDTLRAMTADQLRAYRDEMYVPNNVTFVAAGPIKHDDFVDLVDLHHGDRKYRDFPQPDIPQYIGGTAHSEMSSATLSNVLIAGEGAGLKDADFYAFEALEKILAGGDSAPLKQGLIYDKGLTSSVSAGLYGNHNNGRFLMIAPVDSADIRTLIGQTYEIFKRVSDNVTPDMLDRVKAQIEMEALSQIESNRAACDTYGRQMCASGEVLTPAEIKAKIQAVTIDDLQKAADRVLNSNPTVSMIVPPGTDPSHIPGHDEVVDMRDKALASAASPAPASAAAQSAKTPANP